MQNTLEGLYTNRKNSATIASTVAFIHAFALFFLLTTSPFKQIPKVNTKIAVRTVQLTKQTPKKSLPKIDVPEQFVALQQEHIMEPTRAALPEAQIEQEPEEVKPEPEPAPQPAAKSESKTKPKPVSKPAPKPIAKPAAKTVPKSTPKPAPKPVAKPKPKLATKTPAPTQKESAEKKKKEQEAKRRQEKEHQEKVQREREAKQNALVQDALSALNNAKSADKKRAATSSPSGSYQKTSPSAIGSLASDSLVCIQATDEVLVGREKTYYDELVQRLKLYLKLPDHGDVKIHLTLSKQGKVLKVDCKNAKSSKNATYLQKTLPTIVFPSFGSSFSGEESHTFHFHFANELSY